MIELIPSKDVREMIEKTGRTFTDFEKAAIISHLGLPIKELHKNLKQIADNSQDRKLRNQIIERITYDDNCHRTFKENKTGFVYAVQVYKLKMEPYICGYFADADLAFKHGKNQGYKFAIRKYQIVGVNGHDAIKAKCYINPYFCTNLNPNEVIREFEYDGEYIAELIFDNQAKLRGFFSDEVENHDRFNPDKFENAYIEIPNPFEKGDTVKLIGDDKCYIVRTSQKEWKSYNKKMKFSEYTDFSDASITVDLLRDNKTSHAHICPIFLEKIE